MSDVQHPRDRAAHAAVTHVQAGMVVGLGSGDTASRAIVMLGERARAGLTLVTVATSEASARLGASVGLDVRQPEEVAAIDVTIDGADEIDDRLRLIKGAGAAHTREKLVARASRQLIIVADAHKRVKRLGERARLPVEIVAFAHGWTLAQLAALGFDPQLRMRDGAPLVTDNAGLIADCRLPEGEPEVHAATLKALTGVIEHGLFLGEATLAYIGTDSGVERLTRTR